MTSNRNNAPERLFRYAKHGSYSCLMENVRFSKQIEKEYDECDEYILKSTADKQKSNMVTLACHNALQEEKDGLLKAVKSADKL